MRRRTKAGERHLELMARHFLMSLTGSRQASLESFSSSRATRFIARAKILHTALNREAAAEAGTRGKRCGEQSPERWTWEAKKTVFGSMTTRDLIIRDASSPSWMILNFQFADVYYSLHSESYACEVEWVNGVEWGKRAAQVHDDVEISGRRKTIS